MPFGPRTGPLPALGRCVGTLAPPCAARRGRPEAYLGLPEGPPPPPGPQAGGAQPLIADRRPGPASCRAVWSCIEIHTRTPSSWRPTSPESLRTPPPRATHPGFARSSSSRSWCTAISRTRYRREDPGGICCSVHGRVKSVCDLVRSKHASSATWGFKGSRRPQASASGGFTGPAGRRPVRVRQQFGPATAPCTRAIRVRDEEPGRRVLIAISQTTYCDYDTVL